MALHGGQGGGRVTWSCIWGSLQQIPFFVRKRVNRNIWQALTDVIIDL